MGRKYQQSATPTSKFKYESTAESTGMEKCERAGDHVAHVEQWPPVIRTSNPDGGMDVRCSLCNCHATLYAGNVAEQSGWVVVEPKREKQPA